MTTTRYESIKFRLSNAKELTAVRSQDDPEAADRETINWHALHHKTINHERHGIPSLTMCLYDVRLVKQFICPSITSYVWYGRVVTWSPSDCLNVEFVPRRFLPPETASALVVTCIRRQISQPAISVRREGATKVDARIRMWCVKCDLETTNQMG